MIIQFTAIDLIYLNSRDVDYFPARLLYVFLPNFSQYILFRVSSTSRCGTILQMRRSLLVVLNVLWRQDARTP